MKFNFKKISAIASSLLITGMTMGVAAAVSFPAPFSDGSTSSVGIVYGANSASSDGTAAVNINSYLVDKVSDVYGEPTGESYLFEKSTDKLNVGETLTMIKSTDLDKDELPTILASGTYSNHENSDYAYEQKINLSTSLAYSYFVDDEYNSEKPSLGIRISDSTNVFSYTLDFVTSPVDNTNSAGVLADFEDTTIQILGKTYDIVDASNSSNTLLTLMSGTAKDALSLLESGTYTVNNVEYTVTVTYVDSDECKFDVNGESTDKLLDGGVDKLTDGTQIGVTEVDYSTGAVTEIMKCEFYIGATKIDLEDTKEMEIDDVDVDNLNVFIDETIDGNTFKLNKIILGWNTEDDLFIAEDSSIAMPGFGSVKLSYTGLVLPENGGELIKARGASNNEAKITVNLKSKDDVEIAILGTNDTGGFEFVGGQSSTTSAKGLVTSNVSNAGGQTEESIVPARGAGVTNIRFDLGSNKTGDKYFVSTYYDGSKTCESYLVEVSADDTDGVDFKDGATNTDITTHIKNGTTFDIGDASYVMNTFRDDQYVSFNATGSNTYIDRLCTKEGLMIYLPIYYPASTTNAQYLNLTNSTSSGAQTYILRMDEEDKDGTMGSGRDINVTFDFATLDVQAKIATAAEAEFNGADMQQDDADETLYTAYVNSSLGTFVKYVNPSSGADSVDVTYYGEEIYGNFYISEDASAIAEAGDMIFKDIETGWRDRDVVLVGGSCINAATAEALGVAEETCEDAFTTETNVGPGQFLIGAYEGFATGKIALVVAGYHADDTVAAASYLVDTANTIDTTVGAGVVHTVAGSESTV